MLHLLLVQRTSVRPSEPAHAPDGTRLAHQEKRQTTYSSAFGKIRFRRPYFHAPGQKGVYPLEAELSLPPRCYSNLLRNWAEYCTTDESYDESNRVLKRILGLSLSKQALETAVEEDAVDVEAFYEQKAAPPVETEGSILVIQADGKGMPMVRDESAKQSARRGKGQKKTKEESVVTAIYTIASYLRTPHQVVDALLPAPERSKKSKQDSTQPRRPTPIGKQVRATMKGKAFAIERLSRRVDQSEGEHIEHQVALTDGAEALQDGILDVFSPFELTLDIIHVSEYLEQRLMPRLDSP